MYLEYYVQLDIIWKYASILNSRDRQGNVWHPPKNGSREQLLNNIFLQNTAIKLV